MTSLWRGCELKLVDITKKVVSKLDSLNLYPYQKTAALFHLDRRYSMNCSEMGLGKSRMALAAAKLAKHKEVAVFAPSFLKGTWEREVEEMGLKLVFVPYSRVAKMPIEAWWPVADCKFWIIDEATYVKNPTAARTKAIHRAVRDYIPDYLVLLTGTPIRNRVYDFWALLALLDANPNPAEGDVKLTGVLRSYTGFADYFCHSVDMKLRHGRVRKYGALRDDRVEDLKKLIRGKYVRFTVESVKLQLPEYIEKRIYFDLQEIPGMEATFKAYMEGTKVESQGKEMSARLKCASTAAYAESLFEDGIKKCVIFTDHVFSAVAIASALKKYGVASITGATKMADREKAIVEFQTGDKVNIIVATIGALAVGVTLTAAQDVIFNDLSWVPADNTQAKKRIHRIGQTLPCRCHYMVAGETDAYIQKTLTEKEVTISKVMGGEKND